MRHVSKILDCTLRDAGYPINFQFNKKDVCQITSTLDACGITRIEVGHGLGVGADFASQENRPFLDNRTTLKLAKKNAKNAQIGMFYIPGIGTISELEALLDEGLDFVRVGFDAKNILDIERDLHDIVSLGIPTSLNLMKSNEVNEEQLYQRVKTFVGMPLDTVSIVDSPGCMLPADVGALCCVLTELNFAFGFHGHDNLGLAMANSVAAASVGAEWIDSTLLGMGRSLGNVRTELLALVNRKTSEEKTVNVELLLHLAEQFGAKFKPNFFDKKQTLMGYAELHSGFEQQVDADAFEDKVNVHSLLLIAGDKKIAYETNKFREINIDDCLIKNNNNVSLSWRAGSFDEFLDDVMARSKMPHSNIIIRAYENQRFFHKFSVERRINDVYIFHLQISSNEEKDILKDLEKDKIISLYVDNNIISNNETLNNIAADDSTSLILNGIRNYHSDNYVFIHDKIEHKLTQLQHGSKGSVVITFDLPTLVESFDIGQFDLIYLINRTSLPGISPLITQKVHLKLRIIEKSEFDNYFMLNDFYVKRWIDFMNNPLSYSSKLFDKNTVPIGRFGSDKQKIIKLNDTGKLDYIGGSIGNGALE